MESLWRVISHDSRLHQSSHGRREVVFLVAFYSSVFKLGCGIGFNVGGRSVLLLIERFFFFF